MPEQQTASKENKAPEETPKESASQGNIQEKHWGKTIIFSIIVFILCGGVTFISLKIFLDKNQISFLEKLTDILQKENQAQEIDVDDDISNINVNKEEPEDNGTTEVNSNMNTNTATSKNKNTNAGTNENTNSVQKKDTSAKTFASQAIPISFNYPQNWSLWEGSSPLSDFIQMGDYLPKDSDIDSPRIPGHKLEVTMQTKPAELTLAAWIEEMDSEIVITPNLSDTEVDGFPAKIDTQQYGISVGQTVYIPLGDGTERIIIMALYGPETDPAEITPILETFLETTKIGQSI